MAIVGGGAVRALVSRAWKLKRRGSHTYDATRKWYKRHFPYDGSEFHAHHWLIPRGGWGSAVPDAIKNQPANLHVIPAKVNLSLGNRWGWNYLAKGAPPWAKEMAAGTVATTGSLLVPKDESCECR